MPDTSVKAHRSATDRARKLEYFTIVWNSLEALVAVAAGALAGSVSMVGFGIDSFIEVISGATLLWRMGVDHDDPKRKRREGLALKIVGICFLALAVYVCFDSVSCLVFRKKPEASRLGIVLGCVSLIVMPFLFRWKRNVGNELGSRAMRADARQTEFCLYLSIILLAGLTANAVLGWWWADPVAALGMVPLIAKEGWETFAARP